MQSQWSLCGTDEAVLFGRRVPHRQLEGDTLGLPQSQDMSLRDTAAMHAHIHKMPTHGKCERERGRERKTETRGAGDLSVERAMYERRWSAVGSVQTRSTVAAKAAVDKQRTFDCDMACLSAQGRRTASGPARCRNSLAGEGKILALSCIPPRRKGTA